MELKKNPEYDLRRYVTTFFLSGLLLAELVTLFAFTYSQSDDTVKEEQVFNVQNDIEELPDITQQNEPPPPAPPPPPPTTVEVVEDDVETPDVDFETPEDADYDPTKNAPPPPDDKPEEIKGPDFFEIVEQMPEFPGGDAARQSFINKHLVYPPLSVENGKQGTIVLQFIVEANGTLTDIKAVRSFDDDCAAEAIRVAKLMKWTPGEQRGKKVRVKISMPIKFKLR